MSLDLCLRVTHTQHIRMRRSDIARYTQVHVAPTRPVCDTYGHIGTRRWFAHPTDMDGPTHKVPTHTHTHVLTHLDTQMEQPTHVSPAGTQCALTHLTPTTHLHRAFQ